MEVNYLVYDSRSIANGPRDMASDSAEGFVKLVADAKTDRDFVGAHGHLPVRRANSHPGGCLRRWNSSEHAAQTEENHP